MQIVTGKNVSNKNSVDELEASGAVKKHDVRPTFQPMNLQLANCLPLGPDHSCVPSDTGRPVLYYYAGLRHIASYL